MPHYDTTVTSRGRITLPAELRRYLGIRTGESIEWVDQDRYASLSIREYRCRQILEENLRHGQPPTTGALWHYAKDRPVLTIQEMDEIVEQSIIEEYERKLREMDEDYSIDADTHPTSLLPPVRVRITEKGQISMPGSYRKKFNIQPGDTIVLNDEIDHLSAQKADDILSRIAGSLSAYAGNGPMEIDREQIWTGIATERDERIQRQVAEESGDHDDLD
jgi:AbrB family looped-hinge helix DNA binding protein